MGEDLRFRLLGGVSAWRVHPDGTETELALGGPRPRRLVAALVVSAGRPIAPDRLVELVWGDDAPASARGSLQATISNLRRVLEPGRTPGQPSEVLVLRPGGYQLEIRPEQIDTWAFEQAVAAGSDRLAAGDAAGAVARLQPALDGWAPALSGLLDAPFARGEADRLAVVRQTAFERLQAARIALGDHHAAIAELRRAVTEDPRAERLWGQLALARYRAGEPAEAIATVHAARVALRDAAGLDLGPELRQLETDLYAHAPALAPAPSVDVASRLPAAAHRRPTCRGRRTPTTVRHHHRRPSALGHGAG